MKYLLLLLIFFVSCGSNEEDSYYYENGYKQTIGTDVIDSSMNGTVAICVFHFSQRREYKNGYLNHCWTSVTVENITSRVLTFNYFISVGSQYFPNAVVNIYPGEIIDMGLFTEQSFILEQSNVAGYVQTPVIYGSNIQ